jgi:hypothetical protein
MHTGGTLKYNTPWSSGDSAQAPWLWILENNQFENDFQVEAHWAVPHGGIFSVKRIIMVNMLGRGNSMCDDGELSKVYRKWWVCHAARTERGNIDVNQFRKAFTCYNKVFKQNKCYLNTSTGMLWELVT